jgi:hypothetical protein
MDPHKELDMNKKQKVLLKNKAVFVNIVAFGLSFQNERRVRTNGFVIKTSLVLKIVTPKRDRASICLPNSPKATGNDLLEKSQKLNWICTVH